MTHKGVAALQRGERLRPKGVPQGLRVSCHAIHSAHREHCVHTFFPPVVHKKKWREWDLLSSRNALQGKTSTKR